MSFLSRFIPKSIGLDIGTSSIKIVELSSFGKKIKLENYAQVKSADLGVTSLRVFDKKDYLLFKDKAADAIKQAFQKMDLKPRKATFTLPDFSSFFTTFKLPKMEEKEVEKAVRFHASKYIPVPMTSLAIDWRKISEDPLEVLVVAIPKKALEQYKKLTEAVGIKKHSLEPEAFSIDRAFPRREGENYCFIDIGVQSSTISISNEEGLITSHGLDIAGGKINKVIQKKLGVSAEEAVILKKEKGLISDSDQLSEAILPIAESLVGLTERTLKSFREKHPGQDVDKIIILGGSAQIPGLLNYFENRINNKIELANPFQGLEYPEGLEKDLQELGPMFSVAVGAARRDLE